MRVTWPASRSMRRARVARPIGRTSCCTRSPIEDPVKPTFVVDISDVFDVKMEAIRCYASQFTGAKAAGEIHLTGQDLYELIRVQSAHYGSLIRRRYGEPFYTAETLEVDDVLKLGVQSI